MWEILETAEWISRKNNELEGLFKVIQKYLMHSGVGNYNGPFTPDVAKTNSFALVTAVDPEEKVFFQRKKKT